MTIGTSRKPDTIDAANATYLQRQVAMKLDFKSPFLALNATLKDCVTQRAELGISDQEFERDKATFNQSIIDAMAKHGTPDALEKVDFFFALAHAFVGDAMKQPNVPQNYWPLVACHAALSMLHHDQETQGFVFDATTVNIALFAQHMMNIAWKPARLLAAERIAGESLGFANDFAEKEKKRMKQIKEAQAKQAKERKQKAADSRTLVTETLFPEWRKANPDADKTTGYRHCAKVLTDRGYKSANGSAITWETVKAYFRTKRSTKKALG